MNRSSKTVAGSGGSTVLDGERTPLPRLVLLTLALVALIGFALVITRPAPARAQSDESESTETVDEDTAEEDTGGEDAGESESESEYDAATLAAGAEVYSQICSACHQAGGAGVEGSYPPLINNPNVEDATYVRDVINNGREGEIVVDGVTYNGVMPAFSTLGDDDIDAVVTYIQSGFQSPQGQDGEAAAGPVAGAELPGFASIGSMLAFLLTGLVILMVLWPRLVSRNDRLHTPWLDAYLKAAVIVLAAVLFVAYVPNWVLQFPFVAGLSRFWQDLIGVSIWGLGIAAVVGLLHYAHRERMV